MFTKESIPDETIVTAWISKYALTQGIFEKSVKVCTTDRGERFCQVVNSPVPDYYHGDDWHLTRAEAVAKAEKMRTKKVASIKKQLLKLQNLTF